MRRTALYLMALSLWLPGHGEPKPGWIEIRILPGDGGQASCRYLPSGEMKGSHVSPPPAVRVYEASGKLDAKVSRDLFARAGELLQSGQLTVQQDVSQKDRDYLLVGGSDGKVYSTNWKHKQSHPDAKVAGLAERLFQHHVGGW